jgi:hypothetical protein
LTGSGYFFTGNSLASSGIAAYKSQFPNSGNARTWSLIAIGEGIIGAGIPMIQNQLKSDTQSQQTTITNGVNAKLITNMETMYTVPLGSCSQSVMFIGAGGKGIVKGTIQ